MTTGNGRDSNDDGVDLLQQAPKSVEEDSACAAPKFDGGSSTDINADLLQEAHKFVRNAACAARKLECLTDELSEERRASVFLRQQIKELTASLKEAQESVVQCQGQLGKMRQLELNEMQLREDLLALSGQLNKKAAELAKCQADRAKLQDDNASQAERIAELRAAAERRSAAPKSHNLLRNFQAQRYL